MAKAKRNKATAAAASEPEVPAGKSLLEVAWRAFQAGDSVLARRAAKKLLEGTVKDADEALAKKVGKQLFGSEADARQVAAELALRTKTPLKPYAFVLMSAIIWVLMIFLTSRS